MRFHSNHQIPNHDLNSALWHLYDCKQRDDDSAYRKAAGQVTGDQTEGMCQMTRMENDRQAFRWSLRQHRRLGQVRGEAVVREHRDRLLLRAVGVRRLEQPQLRHRGDHQPGGGAQQGLIVFSTFDVNIPNI